MFFYVMIWYCRHNEITAFAEKCTTEYTSLLTAKNGSDPPPPHPGDTSINFRIFSGYLPLAFQSPYPIIVYSVANYRTHLGLFWANAIFAILT